MRLASPWFVLLGLLALGCRGDAPDPAAPAAGRLEPLAAIEGVILETALSAAALLVEDDAGRVWSVSTAQRPVVLGPDERPSPLREAMPGLSVRIVGERVTRDRFRADTIRITEKPPLVLVQPRGRATLTSALLQVEGHVERGHNARYRLLAGETVLAEGVWRAEVFGTRHYGAFRYRLPIAVYRIPEGHPAGEPLQLEVWPDGMDVPPVRRALRFSEDHPLALYFPSRQADPGRLRCAVVYPVPMRLPLMTPPEEVVRLLVGALAPEHERRGFYAPLAPFGEPRRVATEGDTVVVDLPPVRGVALDACDVQAAQAQLERTLGELFGTASVRMSVGGTPLSPGAP